jgi:hypothetical protein
LTTRTASAAASTSWAARSIKSEACAEMTRRLRAWKCERAGRERAKSHPGTANGVQR